MMNNKDRTEAEGAGGVSNSTPIIFNISGPYAVGKDTVLNEIVKMYPTRVHRVRTVTTRPVLASADPSYEQVTLDQFSERTADGRWVVNRQLSGAVSYGTSIDEIEDAARRGLICVHSIYAGEDGAGKLREVFGSRLVSVALLATPGDVEAQISVLRDRLIKRGRDDAATIDTRLKHQVHPLGYVILNPAITTPDGEMKVFDRVMVNEDLHTTVAGVVEFFQRSFLEGDV